MKTSKQLREERAAVQLKIDELAKTESRSDAQNEEITALFEQRDSLSKNIEATMLIEKEEARKASFEAGKVSGLAVEDNAKREMSKFSLTKMINEIASHKEGRGAGLTGLEKELVEESEKEARKVGATGGGIYLSNEVINSVYNEKRAMTVGSSTAGGNFVPTEKLGFFEALFAATVLNELGVRSLTGLSANTDMIGFTGSVTAAWAAETGTQTPTDATTAARELRPKLLYAACDISRKLMIQTNDSIDRFIMDNMIQAMAVTFEAAVINGAGTNEPDGILGKSGLQSVAIGTNGGAPTYAKILEIIQKVLSADGRNVTRKFLTNPKVVAKLKQVFIDSGSGAAIMGYNGLFQSQMGVIDGYGVSVTANVPSDLDKGSTTGVCSALIFGDFSQVVTGQFGGVELIVDPYTKARTGQVSLTINSFMDSTVLQEGALGAIADLTTT